MIAFICIFVPAVLSVFYYNYKSKYEVSKLMIYIRDYLIALLGINIFNIIFLRILNGYSGNLCEDLNRFSKFAVEYICLSLMVGIGAPFLFWVNGGKLKISTDFRKFKVKEISNKTWYIIAICYALVMILACSARLSDNYFWGDETYSIMMGKMTLKDMLSVTATDVHPPLYYIIVMIMFRVCGNSGWAYHLSAFIPYIIIMIISLTFIWKRWGKETTFLLITFASLLWESRIFNVEVRMYSLAELFIFISFISVYSILSENSAKKNYCIFVLASVLAAYSHYYALVAISFFYLAIIGDSLIYKEKRKKAFIACITAILLYIPWLLMVISNVKRTTEEFWLTYIPSISECLVANFGIEEGEYEWFSWALLALLAVLTIINILLESGILKVEMRNGRCQITVSNKVHSIENDTKWILVGYISVMGTMAFGLIVSLLVRPALLIRYLFPVAIVLWTSLGVLISKMKYIPMKKGITVIIVALTVALSIPLYVETYTTERANNELCEATRKELCDRIKRDDNIVVHDIHLYRTGLRYYVPADCYMNWEFDDYTDDSYWLVWNREIEEGEIEHFQQKGYQITTEFENGLLGDVTVYLYKLSKVNEE